MLRLLFEKKDSAVWISHLDLMRMFQRAFQRAQLPLKHTQGFNPRPSVSIALPLSVGIDSACELLDFTLEGDPVSCTEIRDRLNEKLVAGIRVLEVYENGRKLRDLALLRCHVVLEYDRELPEDAAAQLQALFSRESVVVQKKNKNGIQDQDIIPMLRRLQISRTDTRVIAMEALVCCQNPTLNPMQLPAAIGVYLPELKPDFTRVSRQEIYDQNEEIFR